MLADVAEFERELINARTGEGRARAKARGVRFGRPPALGRHCPDRGEPPWASTMSDRAQPIRPLELPRLGSAGRKCTHSYAFVLDCYSNPEQIPTYARTSVQHSQRIGIKADLIGCARSLTVGAQGGRRG